MDTPTMITKWRQPNQQWATFLHRESLCEWLTFQWVHGSSNYPRTKEFLASTVDQPARGKVRETVRHNWRLQYALGDDVHLQISHNFMNRSELVLYSRCWDDGPKERLAERLNVASDICSLCHISEQRKKVHHSPSRRTYVRCQQFPHPMIICKLCA